MKIIFLGIMFCEASLKSAYQNTRRSFDHAPHVFQTNLLRGFEQIEGLDVKVINLPPTGSFPINNKQLYSKRYLWGNGNTQIGYLNLPFIKRSFIRRKLLAEVEKEIQKTDDRSNLKILLYTVYEPFLDVAAAIRKKYPDIPICLLETDMVPQGADLHPDSRVLAREGARILRKCRTMDAFVLLTKYMTEMLDVDGRPYTVVECICNRSQRPAESADNKENIFLYCGTLDKRYGITTLADAFAGLPQANLWICGAGDSQEYVTEMAKQHSNIHYYGFVDQKTVSQLRDQCNYLINPRTPSGTYTKYSFPSKTAEYLMSGKPTLMYKLEGVPDEYDPYLNYLHATNSDGIREELREFLRTDYALLCQKADRARAFMMNEKSDVRQAEKIVTLLGSC